MLSFRQLRAEEIECRVGACTEKGCSLLLYKTARTDADILDETVGVNAWGNEFREIKGNLFCGVTIEGVTKWDCGTESNTEAEKGEASDAFKRACFKWGIGRELYTAPFIWIASGKCNIRTGKNGRYQCGDRFSVKAIDYEGGKISALKIQNDTTGAEVFSFGKFNGDQAKQEPAPQKQKPAEEFDYSRLKAELNLWADAKGIDRNQAKREIWAALPEKYNQKDIDALCTKLHNDRKNGAPA